MGFVLSTFCSNSPTLNSVSLSAVSAVMAAAAEEESGDSERLLCAECVDLVGVWPRETLCAVCESSLVNDELRASSAAFDC